MTAKFKLVTLAEWRDMSPRTQGYVWYMQAEHVGSELKNEKNPHAEGTTFHKWFEEGVQRGVLEAQDSEE